jgi:hypothetical protein
MHKVVPVCVMAMRAVSGHDDAQTQVPAREKQEPAKRVAVTLASAVRTAPVAALSVRAQVSAAAQYRSLISLGALRCDQDVGWYVLVVTFLI